MAKGVQPGQAVAFAEIGSQVRRRRPRPGTKRPGSVRMWQPLGTGLLQLTDRLDEETADHLIRVGLYTERLARQLGFGAAKVRRLRVAASFHDLGKVDVPLSILQKPGPLTAAELDVVKRHAPIGRRLLDELGGATLDRETLRVAAVVAITHHERFGGGGYPYGLCGEAIPVEGRIVAVADVFDALSSRRAYKPGFDFETSLAILAAGRETQFDPRVLDAFLAVAPRAYETIRGRRLSRGCVGGSREQG